MKRRNFVRNSTRAGLGLAIMGHYACKKEVKNTEATSDDTMAKPMTEPFFKLSLAQWSIHRMIREEGLDPYRFAEKAKEWGFSGLEYVSQLYAEELEAAGYSTEAMAQFVAKCNAESTKHGQENLIIMVDREGPIASADKKERDTSVKNHFKWVDAAAGMGCHSIRVNLQGAKTEEEWIPASVDGLTQLAEYAAQKNINVIVENHGGLSSDAALLVKVMDQVNKPNCGTLPDFGNFCVQREDGSYYSSPCVKEYDRYQGVQELMPYAKAVSAKSYAFDKVGEETTISYSKMLQIVGEAGYTGFVGVEYEGDELGEEAGILATKELLLQTAKQMV